MSAGFTEHELIETLLRGYRSAAPILGPGDDAGILAVPDGRLVTTVDTITEDQDFRRVWPCGYRTTGYDVGWKSVAQNLSDINAMGARPTGIVTSLSLPADIGLDWVESFATGVTDSIEQLGAHDCAIVGGDVGRGREISVTTTAFGSLDGREPLRRSGARPGDVLAVAGNLGEAAAGLAILESKIPEHHWTRFMRRAVNSQLRPRPPLLLGPAAADSGATALMDVSDGLLKDSGRIAGASCVAIDFDLQRVVSLTAYLTEIADLLDADPLLWGLTGGEDYALLATVDPQLREVGLEKYWIPLGEVKAGPSALSIGGKLAQDWLTEVRGSTASGWDPFVAR